MLCDYCEQFMVFLTEAEEFICLQCSGELAADWLSWEHELLEMEVSGQ